MINLRMNYSLKLVKENLEEKALQQLNIALSLVQNYKLCVQMGILYIRMEICYNNLKIPVEKHIILRWELRLRYWKY